MNIEFLTATHKRSTGQAYYATIDRYNNNAFTELTDVPDEHRGHDVFWTPLTFIGQRHNRQATGLNILFADREVPKKHLRPLGLRQGIEYRHISVADVLVISDFSGDE